jgi:quercetin dioxygenase-like cupin family protein
MQLNQLDFLKSRYPGHRIGFSTHEEPGNTRFVQIALAKGATVFEKHVGIPTQECPLNAYSANPEQAERWLIAASEALDALGSETGRYEPSRDELDSLHSLRRGVFLAEALRVGERLNPAHTILAIPTVPGQLTANDLSKYIEYIAEEDVPALGPVLLNQFHKFDNREKVYQIVQRVRTLLQESHTVVSAHVDVEISHHYGLDRFDEVGATIVNIVNRAYCKKLIALLPGQRHPEQLHMQKEETFHVLHGHLQVMLDGVSRELRSGDIVTVERGVRHEFWSEDGTVIEEISSTHFKDDSFYTDPAIGQNPNRKTCLTYFFG